MLEYKRKKISLVLLSILNSKVFHLDRLIWIETNKSTRMKKHLKIIDIEHSVDSKDYLTYKLKNEVHSKNYLYLEKCLRIYK